MVQFSISRVLRLQGGGSDKVLVREAIKRFTLGQYGYGSKKSEEAEINREKSQRQGHMFMI